MTKDQQTSHTSIITIGDWSVLEFVPKSQREWVEARLYGHPTIRRIIMVSVAVVLAAFVIGLSFPAVSLITNLLIWGTAITAVVLFVRISRERTRLGEPARHLRAFVEPLRASGLSAYESEKLSEGIVLMAWGLKDSYSVSLPNAEHSLSATINMDDKTYVITQQTRETVV